MMEIFIGLLVYCWGAHLVWICSKVANSRNWTDQEKALAAFGAFFPPLGMANGAFVTLKWWRVI